MHRPFDAGVCLQCLLWAGCVANSWVVQVNFEKVTGVSNTTTTLQVVTNPILDRTFTAEDGSTFPNPIHDTAWQSLANLGADLVRFVPWFPYPKKSVAELTAPSSDPSSATSWDFSAILPQLEDFMKATLERNHSTVINFSTQPCWLFGDADNKTQNCSFPANPDQSFFGYLRGKRDNLLDPTAGDLAAYYARLLAWLVKGEFVDEHGVRHTGGPKYNMSRHNGGHTWELFNEGEHGYSVEQYIHDWDVVVPAMIEAVDGEANAPFFMGIGGASPDWVVPFLNASNHKDPHTAKQTIEYISLHHYSSCANRSLPSTYSQGFFGAAAEFVAQMKGLIASRDASSLPKAKFDLDELGVIMPDDNDPSLPADADLPPIYWNAAASMYAYLFAQLAPLGVEVLGHSQLAGSPGIPQWGIPLPQYPSVSLLSWESGFGNARYWVLKLLIDHFRPGDRFVHFSVRDAAPTAPQATDGVPQLTALALRTRTHAASPAAMASASEEHKVLLINSQNAPLNVTLTCPSTGDQGPSRAEPSFNLFIVDPEAVQAGSPTGIRTETAAAGSVYTMQPFSVVVAVAAE